MYETRRFEDAKEIRNKKLKIRNKEMQLQLFEIPNLLNLLNVLNLLNLSLVSRNARKGARAERAPIPNPSPER
jgi:hypothetical protein